MQTVRPDAIDHDERFLCRYAVEDELLRSSIERFGVLTPLLVMRKGAGYRIVSGFKRYHAAVSLGLDAVPVCIGDADHADDKEIFFRAIDANSTTVLTDLDKAVIFDKAQNVFGCSMDELRYEVAPRLGLAPSVKLVREYSSCMRINPDIVRMIAEGQLSFKSVGSLSLFSPDEQKCLYEMVLVHCFFSMSDLRRCVELLRAVTKRDHLPLSALLGEETMQAVLRDTKKNPREKGERFISVLHTRLCPQSVAMLQKYENVVEDLSLGKRMHVSPPLNFEGRYFDLHIQFSSMKELERAFARLAEKKDGFHALFHLADDLHFD